MDFQLIKTLRAFLDALFIGFSILIPILLLLKSGNLKFLQFKEVFIVQAVQALRIAGIFYALTYVYEVNMIYLQETTSGQSLTPAKLLPGAYLMYMFYLPAAYLVLTQLLWIKKLYIHKTALITLCVLLLILPQWFYISGLLRISQADYYQPDWLILFKQLLIDAVMSVIIFSFTIAVLAALSGRLKAFKAAS